MNKVGLIISGLLLPVFLFAQAYDWENPQMIGQNKEEYHATLTLPSQKKFCKEVTSLDGVWKFKWSANPESRPTDFYKTGYNAENWDKIVVPGAWQLQGYGMPIYTNWIPPYKRDQPKVTGIPPTDYYSYKNRNPVGSYLTTFNIPSHSDDKRFFLNFGGVKSAMYVWVNGQKVGYSQNSMSPAEFDVTDFVKPGSNRLAVEVYRWSDGSYLEDQDMWRMSGIFRPVELWSRPSSFIKDYVIKAALSADMNRGNAFISVLINNMASSVTESLSLEAKLTGVDRIGNKIDQRILKKISPVQARSITESVIDFGLDHPLLWSAETPYLYKISLTLIDRKSVV